jgi:DNA polymerase (family 10)
MDKKKLAAICEEIATLLELKGENPFKCNAYHNAARTIETLDRPLDEFKDISDFEGIKGIGSSIAEKILTLIRTGHLPYYEELKASLPEGLVKMLDIPGFGPKRARTVYEKLGVASMRELEYACRENRLLELPGFGDKTQENILKGIEYIKKGYGRFLLDEARSAALGLLQSLKNIKGVKHLEVAGSLRRFANTVKDIDILAAATNPASLVDAFTSHPLVKEVFARGETKSSVRLTMGINVDLRIVTERQFPFALMYFTGSKEHNVTLRGRALHLGYKLNEYGLFKREAKKTERLGSEAAVFKRLRFTYIPPELREDWGEIEAAEKGTLPHLITQEDIKGIIHVHTNYSDGLATLNDYAAEATRRRCEYIGISDHSRAAFYANGLSPERLLKQLDEINALNKKLKNVRLFKGIESDILPNGSLDYPDEILEKLEFVIASVHSKFKMPKEEMTRRIIKAMENPHTTILGHPTGRLLLGREGYELDMSAIIDTAARHGVIIELNCQPLRLDLDWHNVRKAIEAGVRICICPDAHRLDELDYTELGVGMARKGWCEPRHVLNTLSARDVEKIFQAKR